MTKILIEEIGDGGLRFAARLTALERNLEAVPIASAEVMKALELYNDKTWGRWAGSDSEATDERWPGHGKLYVTGALKASLTSADADGAIRELSPFGFNFGTSLFYARFLQKGTKKMPPHVVANVHAWTAVAALAMKKFMERGVFI